MGLVSQTSIYAGKLQTCDTCHDEQKADHPPQSDGFFEDQDAYCGSAYGPMPVHIA